MKILITGTNGFIGSNLRRYFSDRGNEVTGLVRPTSDLHFLAEQKVRLVRGDLSRPEEIDFPPDVEYVVHSASIVSDTPNDALCHDQIHVLAVNLVERPWRLRLPVKRFVYISTALTLGFDGNDISE